RPHALTGLGPCGFHSPRAAPALMTLRRFLPQHISPSVVCAQDPGRDGGSTEEKKPSKSQQLRKIFQEYGAVGVSLHIGISLISLGVFYTVISSGVDMSAVLLKLGFKESLVQSKMAAGTSTFVVASAIHKLFAPVRISITLVSVPFIVRYFRKVGFFKPPAAKP
uniref:Family with sequence similarity 210 member B n=1 Tax=Panthera tigris altaica TaxID=74533 RepID=A0A8C9K3H2_PANTA